MLLLKISFTSLEYLNKRVEQKQHKQIHDLEIYLQDKQVSWFWVKQVNILSSHHNEWSAIQKTETGEISVKFEFDQESFLSKYGDRR